MTDPAHPARTEQGANVPPLGCATLISVKETLLARLLPVVVGLAGVAAASLYVLDIDAGDWRPVRADGERAVPRSEGESVGPDPWRLRREVLSDLVPPADGNWPGFRGPDRDAICKNDTRLASSWPAESPPVLWRIHLGEGHAGAAVRNGRVYVLDHEPPEFLLLRSSEVLDWPEFCRRLIAKGNSPDPSVAGRLWELLPAESRAEARSVAEGGGEAAVRDRLVQALNAVMERADFYRADRVGRANLPAYLSRWIAENPLVGVKTLAPGVGYQKILRVHRALLEDAFPGILMGHWRGDALRCFSLADGRELWRTAYVSPAKIEHGVSRTVPAVTDRHVVTLGPRGHVACFDAEAGEPLWRRSYPIEADGEESAEHPYIDLVREYGAKAPDWHAAQCPLIETGADGRELAILAPGGRRLFVAIECATGEVAWETPSPTDRRWQGVEWTMSHASVMPARIAGRRMFIACFHEGVAAADAETGELLWTTDAWSNNVIAPSPVPLPEDRIFFTAGYGGGSLMMEIDETVGRMTPRVVFRKPEREFGCYQQTPVFCDGLLYSVVAKGRHDGELACMTPRGDVLWYSGGDHRFGWGPFAMAGGRMFVLGDEGVLTMAEVSARGFVPLDRARVLPADVEGGKAWGPMAFAAGRLIVRNETEMVCLDLREPNSP